MSENKKDLKALREENRLLREKLKALEKKVAEHKETEKALRDNREEFKSIFDNVKDSILIETIDGKILDANRAACRMLGYGREDLVKLTVGDVVPKHIAHSLPAEISDSSVEAGHYIESEQLLKNGRRIPVEVSTTLVEIGGQKRVIAVLRDITRRKQIEEALEASKTRLRSIIENSADGIMIIDENGTVRFVNPAAARMFDQPAGDFVGEPFAIPLTGGETAEIAIERPDRRRLEVEIRVSEVSWEGVNARLATLRDVTERKELEKFKDDFINTVSHEMRNPLGVLRVGIGQVRDGIPGPVNRDQHEILSITLREIDRLSRLVDNLLDLSKIESGRVNFERVPFDFNSLIAAAAEKYRQPAEEKGLRLTVTPAPGPLPIYADPDRLDQVLTNLIGNAIKFTPGGGEIVVSSAPAGGEIECAVKDSGIGIPAEDVGRMFDKFTQHSYPGAGDDQGSGLGLAITRELVELHGGWIWAESEPGRGSRFTFRIPDHRSEESLADYLDGLRREVGGGFRFGPIGFRLDQVGELKREWGEEIFSAFTRKFFQRIGLLIQELSRSMPHCWLIDGSRWFTAVLRGAGTDEVRKIHESVLRKIRKLRFHRGDRPLEFELSSAGISRSREVDGPGLIAELKDFLQRPESRVPRSRFRGTVLVVDDEPLIVKMLTTFLKRENIEAVSALDGDEALAAATRIPVDVIILDLVLPKVSGYEVINQLKKNSKTFDIPLILVSGYDIDRVRLKKSGTGAAPVFLKKPFDNDELREAVNRMLAIEDVQL